MTASVALCEHIYPSPSDQRRLPVRTSHVMHLAYSKQAGAIKLTRWGEDYAIKMLWESAIYKARQGQHCHRGFGLNSWCVDVFCSRDEVWPPSDFRSSPWRYTVKVFCTEIELMWIHNDFRLQFHNSLSWLFNHQNIFWATVRSHIEKIWGKKIIRITRELYFCSLWHLMTALIFSLWGHIIHFL